MSTSLPPVNWLGPEMIPNPFPVYAKMRAAAPIYPIEPGGLGAVTRYEDIITVLKNPAVFSSAASRPAFEPPWLGHNPGAESVLLLDPPDHTKNRALVAKAFTPAVVAAMEPQIRRLAGQLVDEWLQEGEVDVIEDVATRLAIVVIAGLMGLDPEWQVAFRFWSNIQATLLPVPSSEDYEAAVRQGIEEMEDFFKELLVERRQKPGNDLVSLLLQSEMDGRLLSEKELVGFLSLLLVAGFETSANLIGKSVNFLSEQPQLYAALQKELTLVPKFIEEMLRYDGVAHAIFRTALQDTELGGTAVKAGTPLMLVLAAANRDPQQFPDPDRFDYNRDNLHHTAFGHGIHFCLGAPLARLEARVMLETIVSRGRSFELTRPAEWKRGMSTHGILHLFARLIPA